MRKLSIITTLIVAILCFAALEWIATKKYAENSTWFGYAQHVSKEKHIDFLFFGSSTMAASVDVDIFTSAIFNHTGQKPVALNLGRGYTRMAEYYLGLRKLYEQNPESLRGCVVFLGAAEGLVGLDTWEDPWYSWARPNYIQPYLFCGDIVRAWNSHLERKYKFELTTLWLTKSISLISHQKKIRAGVLNISTSAFKGIFGLNSNAPFQVSTNAGKIAPAAGVLLDDHSIERIREAAHQLGKDAMRNQRVVGNWNQTVLADLDQLITKHHGKLVLLDIPLSSAFTEAYQTDVQKQNRRMLKVFMKNRGIAMVTTDIIVSDEDFPDLWHLRKSRMREFTTKLVSAYLDHSHNRDRGLRKRDER